MRLFELKFANMLAATLGLLAVSFIYVYSAQYHTVGSAEYGPVTVNEWGVCRKVLNITGLSVFVPTNSAAEWSAARTAFSTNMGGTPPGGVPGVSHAACTPCQPMRGAYDESGTCNLLGESYDGNHSNEAACAAYCESLGATVCAGIWGAGGPYCRAFSGAGCTIAPGHSLWNASICSY